MFCRHKWEKISDTVIESNFERASKTGAKQFQYLLTDLEATHVVVLNCTKCGKINKLVTKT